MTERDFNEYDFDPDITEHEGFVVGDFVTITEDDKRNATYMIGEEGQIVGFATIEPAESPEFARAFGRDAHGRTAIYVLMEGSEEPVEVHPSHMEAE